MKYCNTLSLLLLILCVSVHCIVSAAGSYNYGLRSTKTASKGLLPAHNVHKRQASISEISRCGGLAIEEVCNNGQFQAVAEVALNCNESQTAQLAHTSCRRNSIGRYCDVSSYLLVSTRNITAVCVNSTTECSTDCRNILVLTRNELGCCINIGLNDSSNILYDPEAFNYTLWSNCNVEPVTEQCTPSTISLPQTTGSTCTPSSLLEQLNRISCTRQYVEPVLDILSSGEGCELFQQSILEQCGVNEFGRLCTEELSSITEQFFDTSLLCEDTENCSEACMEALQGLKQTSGCCINNIFNGSFAGVLVPRTDWLSFEFWTLCGLTTPGICEARLFGAGATSGTPSGRTGEAEAMTTGPMASDAVTLEVSNIVILIAIRLLIVH